MNEGGATASGRQYSIYGIRLSSAVTIPGLFESGARDERGYDVRFGAPVRPAPELVSGGGTAVRHDGSHCDLRFADETRVEIDRERRVVLVSAPSEATMVDTATYLTGPVAGMLARLEGRVCLHAAVVRIDDEAHAIVGPSESGKSTTAAAFARAGFRVLSDDVCAIVPEREALVAQPGSSRVRLWPHGAGMALGVDHGLPRITPTWDKLYLDLVEADRFEQAPTPLGGVWLLGEGSEIVTTLSGAVCLTRLVENVYLPEHGTTEMRRRDFSILATVCERIPVRLLPSRLDPSARVRAVLEQRAG